MRYFKNPQAGVAQREYKQSHLEQVRVWRRAQESRRRSRIKIDSEASAVSLEYRKAIESDPCFYCGNIIPNRMQDDHFFPLAKGGTDYWWNLVRACGPCNLNKSARCGTWFILKGDTRCAV